MPSSNHYDFAFPNFGWTHSVFLVTFITHNRSTIGGFAVKQPNALLKLAVLTSSVLLAGGCISFHSGALDWLKGAKEQSADFGKSTTLDKNSADGSNTGNKSVQNGRSQQSPSANTQERPIFISTTKSFAPNSFISGVTPAGTNTPDLGIPKRSSDSQSSKPSP